MSYKRATILDDGNVAVVPGHRLRVIIGNCPECGAALACLNAGEGWPLLRCGCDWKGDTDSILNKTRADAVAI